MNLENGNLGDGKDALF